MATYANSASPASAGAGGLSGCMPRTTRTSKPRSPGTGICSASPTRCIRPIPIDIAAKLHSAGAGSLRRAGPGHHAGLARADAGGAGGGAQPVADYFLPRRRAWVSCGLPAWYNAKDAADGDKKCTPGFTPTASNPTLRNHRRTENANTHSGRRMVRRPEERQRHDEARAAAPTKARSRSSRAWKKARAPTRKS